MLLRENELARKHTGGLELRDEPLRVKWDFTDLVTADGHELRVGFSVSVRAVPDRTEQQVLAEVLLAGRTALFAEDVSRHFFAALRSAAARTVQGRDAKAWLEDDSLRQPLIEAMKSAAVSVAFACGLEILPPFQIDLKSTTYERQRVQALQQVLAEKEAAGQVQRLARAAELLKQFQALRSAAPDLSAGQVLQRVGAADRGSLMQATLMAGAKQESAAPLWAVAGPYLVRIETRQSIETNAPPASQLFPLPPMLGPLRSVQAEEIDGRRMLLVGAQRGFFLIREEDVSDVQAYQDAAFESSLGFNRVIYWPERRQYCATHSQAGLVCWAEDVPTAPAKIMRPAALGIFPALDVPMPTMVSMSVSIRGGGGLMGPRSLRRLNAETLVFAAGGQVIAWDGNSARTISELSQSEIVLLATDRENIQIVQEDGMVRTIDSDGNFLTSARQYGRVRSAATLPWMGGSRLLLGADDGPVQCVGFDDPVVTQYFSSYRDLRALAASAGLVAGVSPDRQRIILWNSWEGRSPAAELFIAAQARHRVADIAFS